MAFSTNQHADWLSLIEVSGPFLAEPILNQAFPQGLEKLDSVKKRQFRQTYDEWREVIDSDAQEDLKIKDKIHQQWTNWVLKFGLELDEDQDGDVLKDQSKMHASIEVTIPEHQVTIKPEYAVVASDETKPYMLIQTYPAGTALSEVLTGGSLSTTPAERMAHLCRGVGTRLGLITNGEQWMFIDAPVGGITTYASWYARLWGLEPITLKAFYSLFNIGVVFNGFDEAKTLSELIDESLQHQDDVTQTLGVQVSRAVEVLIQSIDRINHDHNGELLEGVEPEELYEAGLTLMMRLVFLLCAEERGLLLLGDQAYEANYAISTLRAKLREDASLHGDEVLSYRKNAWARLLAIFRSVYSGVEHENMRMPALGGSLFDPDRFPFLEGRKKGSSWLEDDAKPLPIDNRTVLLFLDAIQLYQGRTLSYRALDVEQIGYVYEGLLEQTVKRAPDVTLELSGSKICKKPWVQLGELASAALDGLPTLKSLLKERTSSSPSRITNDLNKEVTDADVDKLLVACYNDMELCQRIKPYYHFLRFDAWGNPLLYPKGAFMLTTGTDRRETGSHYTPKSLTQSIVTETLEPVVYIGPVEGKPREEWQLKSPEALLDLKICDPAMGSGAFLVQVCRWLAERVCESWLIAEQTGVFVTVKGATTHDEAMELLPIDAEERLIVARRLISERCIYGVDINPLAVELAKLSIWLVTLSKDRPFGYLDHNLKSGDSLLGIHNLDQLLYVPQVKKSKLLELPIAAQIKELVADVAEVRRQIGTHDCNTVFDVDEVMHTASQARESIELTKILADTLVGLTLEGGGKLIDPSTFTSLSSQAFAGDDECLTALKDIAKRGLSTELPDGKAARVAFHWCLEFPEVFGSVKSGFDAIVGNPPFLGGKKISTYMGKKYRSYLIGSLANNNKGSADLVAYFFLRSFEFLKTNAAFGLIAVNSIAEGETRKVGLESILEKDASIYSAVSEERWPGNASVMTSRVCIYKGFWRGNRFLDARSVDYISGYLTEFQELTPMKLEVNKDIKYIGSYILGKGFILTDDEAGEILSSDGKYKDVIFPYIVGNDINSSPEQKSNRYVVNFWDWDESKAKTYPLAYQIIESKVKAERQRLKSNGDFALRKPLPQRWWQYADKRPALYHKIGMGKYFESHPKNWKDSATEFVVVAPRNSKFFNVITVPASSVFSEQVVVLAGLDTFGYLVLLSSVFDAWVKKQSSSLGQGMRFTPDDCLLTFPFPEKNLDLECKINQLVESYELERKSIMFNRNIGLTMLTNLYHNSQVCDEDIDRLRSMVRNINELVFKLFGWSDICVSYGFSVTQSGEERYGVGEMENQIIQRLNVLNNAIYDKENN
ncbi:MULTISPECIES: Eco57I restriction-modification methylase domain-containing protein [Vibrio]|uniref:Eco57I restriction-modification methylase domain-containing protein n=1 Tax=Vibrio TaxID=662 RepID=UPI000C82CD9B|nr:DNA methyltransferase [Vibrio lentus]PMJ05233.1 hypothetical protein BCU31_06605 [Vibrio lentus]